MKKLRLCYIAPPHPTNTVRWLSYFRDAGHEVCLITTGSCFIDGIEVFVFGSDHGSSRVMNVAGKYRKLQRIRRIIQKTKPDILHAHFLGWHGMMGALSEFHPFFGTAWGSDIFLLPYVALKRYVYTRYCLKKLDLITIDSSSLRKGIQKLGGDPGKCRKILWGVDTCLFREGISTDNLRERLGISKEARVIYSVRTVRPIFNVDVILRAFKLLSSERGELILMIKTNLDSASHDCAQELRYLATQLNIEDKVRWLPFCAYEELPLYYNLSDVVVSIASSDATPSSVLEAMACGTPLITSNIESMKEWIREGWNGYTVDPRDVVGLKEAIARTLDAPLSIRREFAERNKRLVKETGDHCENMERMERIYYEFLRR